MTQVKEGTAQVLLVLGIVVVLILTVLFVGWALIRGAGGQSAESAPRDATARALSEFWGPQNYPIPLDAARNWAREWHSRWAYRDLNGELRPYVDDVIILDEPEGDDGFISGRGRSTYEKGVFYHVAGLVSTRDVGFFYYSTPGKSQLAGMFILKMNPMGTKARGWWLGSGRDEGQDIGGQVGWTWAEEDDAGFQPKTYDYPASGAE